MSYKRGEHPHSLKNLEKFQKGQSGNPRGRPLRELTITSILREQLGEPCPKDPSKTWAEWLALRALELAGENPAYYRELMDRLEGKVVFPIKEEKPDEILFIIGKGYANPKTGELPNQPRETLTQGDEADPDRAVPLTD